MAHPLDDFILQFSAHRGKIGIITGYPDQQVAVILRMFLGIAQYIRIKYVDLQSAAAVFTVALQKCLELFFMLGVPDNRRVKCYGVACTIG